MNAHTRTHTTLTPVYARTHPQTFSLYGPMLALHARARESDRQIPQYMKRKCHLVDDDDDDIDEDNDDEDDGVSDDNVDDDSGNEDSDADKDDSETMTTA